MKRKRFLSLFLALLMSLLLVPSAFAAGDDGPVLPEEPEILAKAALLMDYNTGAVVYAQNEHEELYPASLTKIMTALLVLDAVEAGKLTLDQEVTASASALDFLSTLIGARVIFSRIVLCGNRLKCWNTIPIF